ncbi:MAG: T9SS type A sorting domain-containing protein [Bacteroidaceae bacterium]|nr:T9SS type A sorting domain-containing protein [Bacteroidaceae bacterium]
MKRLTLTLLLFSAVVMAMAKDNYLPSIVDNREYIYVNGNDTIRLNTRLSTESEGYIEFYNRWPNTLLKENGSLILLDIDEFWYYTTFAYDVFKENFTTFDNDAVYFDYNMQVGDTLCVIHSKDYTSGQFFFMQIYGKIIEVQSIDTLDIQSEKRLRYVLQSRFFDSSLSETYEESVDQPPHNFEAHYKMYFIGTPYYDEWIEGIGYTTYTRNERGEIYTLQCVFEDGELIYCADGAKCDGLSDNVNNRIDLTTLSLHREGDVLMAIFAAADAGETITLYDTTGRIVADVSVREGATSATIDIAHLPQGVYIAHMNSGASCKVVL